MRHKSSNAAPRGTFCNFKQLLLVLSSAALCISLVPQAAFAAIEPIVELNNQESTSQELAIEQNDNSLNTGNHVEDEDEGPKATLTVPLFAYDAAVVDCYPSKSQAAVDFRVHGGSSSVAKSTKFAIWSDDAGQDDIRWYDGTRLDQNLWGLTIFLSNHRSYGTYTVHVYDTSNGFALMGAGSFRVDAPKAKVAISQTDSQIASGLFTVTISDVSKPDAVSGFRVPVWSEEKGQDDIVWYGASKVSANVWQVIAPCVGGKRAMGLYNAHVYAVGHNGFTSYAGDTSAQVKSAESKVAAVLSADEMTATVTLSGPAALNSSRVQFPTWSDAGGQNDLIWHDASRNGDGTWSTTIEIARHATAGLYISHAYSHAESGFGFAGEARFNVSPITAKAQIANTANGAYKIEVTGISSASGVSKVQIPTWSESGGQDDIVWHDAKRVADNTWTSEISAAEHNGEDGAYNSHVYVTSGNGILTFIDAKTINMSCKSFAFVSGTIGSGWRSILIKHPASADVKIAVWSDEGGHDDLAWYGRTDYGASLYGARIDLRGMLHAGMATAHIYVSGVHTASLQFWISGDDLIPPEYRSMHERIRGLSSATNYLIATDTTRCIVGIFSGSAGNWRLMRSFQCAPGAQISPTVTGQFTVTGRGYVFGKTYSCYYWTQFYGNYLFHSILFDPGTFRVQDGTMGRRVSHGCVRLELENAKWIWDNIPNKTKVVVY